MWLQPGWSVGYSVVGAWSLVLWLQFGYIVIRALVTVWLQRG